jgi:hypothetical protein
MLHVRLIAPSETTPDVLQFLEASPAVTHLCVNEQSARKPQSPTAGLRSFEGRASDRSDGLGVAIHIDE